MRLWPQLAKASGLTYGRTVYVPDNFETWHPDQQRATLVHEATHVRQGMRLPVIHTILYGIGSPWLLLCLMALAVSGGWAWMWIIVGLALSTTGLIFPHYRAWVEYEAYKNGDVHSYRLLTTPGDYLARRTSTFTGYFYFWMGGLWGRMMARRLETSVRRELGID